MTDEHEIVAASDRTMEILDRLKVVEQDKREVPLGSAGFVSMAEEVEQLTRVLFRWAGYQLELARDSSAAVARGELPARALNTIEPRPLDRVLALWREAQIRLELARPGSPEAQAAVDDMERLREEYHATTERKFAEPEVRDWRT